MTEESLVDLNGRTSQGEIKKIDYLKQQGLKNPNRVRRVIKDAIRLNDLDLNDLIVFTEAASRNYVVTPIIAAMAGAKVYAITSDSPYGKAKDIEEFTYHLADFCGVRDKIEVVFEKKREVINKANIVTNLGFVRPIDKKFISYMKENAVIPLMKETWEFRESDIDLNECNKKGIPVLGTNENHPNLRIFDYLGHLCAKKLFELDIEIFKSNIGVIGGGDFGLNIMKYLVRLGADVYGIYQKNDKKLIEPGVKKIAFDSKWIDISTFRDMDCLIVASYPDLREIVGEKGLINPEDLNRVNPEISIIQFMGSVDRESIINAGIPLLPKRSVPPDTMPWTLDELGPKPVIDLHTGGLKVGEIMARLKKEGYTFKESVERALVNDFVQDFVQDNHNTPKEWDHEK